MNSSVVLKRVHGSGCERVSGYSSEARNLRVVWWCGYWFKEGAWFGLQEGG